MIRYGADQLSALADPEARKFLVDLGLPSDHLLFSADPDVAAFDAPDGRQVISLGEVGEGERLCVDVRTGEVVSIGPDGDRIWHINASVQQFSQSLEFFADGVPYYPVNAELDEREAAADTVRTGLSRIDPTALQEDPGFWNTVLFDVGVGDYADE